MNIENITQYEKALRSHGCIISRNPYCELHHCRAGSLSKVGINTGGKQKSSDWLQIPLHKNFHTGNYGIHTMGVLTWEAYFDAQINYLYSLCRIFNIDVFSNAGFVFDNEMGRFERIKDVHSD